MWLFNDEYENAYPSAFIDSLVALMDHGRETSPRGMKTKELDHVSFKVDPRKSLFASPLRKLNFSFLISENLWYWSGRNSTEIPSYYIKGYRKFSNDGIHQGSYSPQILEQIRYVVDSLKEDTDTRQASMTLWRPNPNKSKDTPCTLVFDFKIRDGKLNMHIMMRSNDAIFGSNYDIPSFSMIQIAIAGVLGVPVGFLYLTANSYHIYETHFSLAEELIKESWSCGSYPKELEIIPCEVSSLEEHIKHIETILGSHYCWKMLGKDIKVNDNLPDFYKQFHYMMGKFEGNDFNKELAGIESPFGYTDDYLSSKK